MIFILLYLLMGLVSYVVDSLLSGLTDTPDQTERTAILIIYCLGWPLIVGAIIVFIWFSCLTKLLDLIVKWW